MSDIIVAMSILYCQLWLVIPPRPIYAKLD